MELFTNLSDLIFTLVLVGFLTETVVEILKVSILKNSKGESTLFFVSLIVGMVLVFALQVSLFDNDNLFAYYVGMVICGLVASRGSNYVHNWLGQLPTKKK